MADEKETAAAGVSAGPDASPVHSGLKRSWDFHGFVSGGVAVTLGLCVLSLALYFLGNVPELGFSDTAVLGMLRLQRYISLALCIFSLGAMGFSVHRMVYNPRLINIVKLIFFFLTGILGAFLAILNSFIIAATGGNG
ncbi:MAG: hypothetical protein LBD48_04300 [Treponema sp.]|jgi:hypothetical protein|nr:hypothetical protein [Treponema sp.]